MKLFGRRLLGLLVDWAAALLIATQLFGVDLTAPGPGSLVPLATLFVEHTLLVGTAGFSLGHRLVGLRVTDAAGQAPGLPRAVLRSLLLVLVVPAVIWDSQGRGMHDRLAGTDIVHSKAA